MPRFQVTVIETYTNSFSVDAEDSDEAAAFAEQMAVDRAFPPGNSEQCERSVDAVHICQQDSAAAAHEGAAHAVH